MSLPDDEACAEYVRNCVNSVLEQRHDAAEFAAVKLRAERELWPGLGDVHVVRFDAHRGKG